MEGGGVFHLAEEEEIHRRDVQSAVSVLVGVTEQIAHAAQFQSGLFPDLAGNGLLGGLVDIHEAAGEVEHALAGLKLATLDEDLVPLVQDEADDGGARVQKILKMAVVASQTLRTVHAEMLAAAYGTKLKLLEDIHDMWMKWP